MRFDHLFPIDDIAGKSGRVAVLMGGNSAEREVSLKSGSFVLKALVDAGVDAFEVDVQGNVLQQLLDLEADRVFNVLHGRGGEDGEIQAILDVLKIPYTGSGVKACAVTMDKLMTKRLLQGCGIKTPEYMELKVKKDCDELPGVMDLPVFIKPVNEGSSIGMTKVTKSNQLTSAFKLAAKYGSVMAEQYIDGEEYTVAWLGDTLLPIFKIETPHDFYDYDAKYQANDTAYLCPCGLSTEQEDKLKRVVLKTIEVCGLQHWGRADFLMNDQGEFLIIDVNTVPGMTDHSLVPMAARKAGLSFQQLVLKLIELTIKQEVKDV